jgi:hypothetical protein
VTQNCCLFFGKEGRVPSPENKQQVQPMPPVKTSVNGGNPTCFRIGNHIGLTVISDFNKGQFGVCTGLVYIMPTAIAAGDRLKATLLQGDSSF